MDTIRSRTINFRVTQDEYSRLKAASTLHNARCLSDFARSATLRVAGSLESRNADTAGNQLQSLDRRLTALETNVARLIDALGGKPASEMEGYAR